MSAPVHVGIDVSKLRLDVCILPSRQLFSVDNTAVGHRQLLEKLKPWNPVRVVVESTGGDETPVAQALIVAGLPTARVHPGRVRNFARSQGQLAKTDALDAEILAKYSAASDSLPLLDITSPKAQELRDLGLIQELLPHHHVTISPRDRSVRLSNSTVDRGRPAECGFPPSRGA